MTQSFQQLLVTNYGLLPSGYTGSQGIQGVPGTSDSTPKITAIAVTDSSYTVLDDTAVDVAGGYVQITGTGFASGCVVMINNVPATSTTFVSSTQVQAQLPATAAGTYVVYLVNADGAVAIRINGITFSATPAWSTASALPGTADGTAISIQLAATGADTYALAAGSSLPGSVTLTSAGLLSGVVSGLANETTYSFTVVATDAELQDSPRTFSITITAGDPLFAATTLLLPGNATTFVRDASTNNFAVSIAGDTRPNTFNPYLTGWSNQFDGTGDYLAVPINSTFAFGTSNYTYEAWVYPFAFTNDYNTVFCNFRDDQGLIGWSLLITNNGLIHVNNQGTYNNSTNAISLNTWTHIAVCRVGNTVTRYINGIADPTLLTISASITNPTSQGITIGGSPEYSSGTGRFWNGYISNARVISGTAIYTTNFTPSTTPFAAVAGTSLLTCQSSRFIDNSVNNFAITRNGDVAVRSFSPFIEPATTNGSGYFDGNGDYLTVSANAALDFGTGDFTVEAWVYPINNGQLHPTFLGSITGWSAGASGHRFNNTGYANKFWFGLNGSGGIASGDPLMVSNNTFSFNTWHHYAITRTGNTFRMFVNGVLENTQTYSGSYNAGLGGLRSGWSTWDGANGYWTGSISNLRLVKGTAVYTADFTPPTQPLTAVSGTSLLTLQNNQPVNNSQFLDSSSNNLLITRAGNATQGTSSPYSPSGWSNYFDGSGDYLSAPATDILNFGTGDFTIEAWVYSTNLTNTIMPLSSDGPSRVVGSISFYIRSNGDGFGIQRVTSTAGAVEGIQITDPGSILVNTWNHIAATKVGTTIRLFLNGALVSTQTSAYSSWGNEANPVQIGRRAITGFEAYVTGYISNLRVVKGTALYTDSFTPSTQPLTAIAGTSLLTCQSSGFADLSPNRSAITRAGDVRVTNWSPFRAVVQTPQTYSAYFDGTGDSLAATSSASFNPETVDFTVELWAYNQTTDSTNRKCLIATRPVATPLNGWVLFVSTTGFVGLAGWNSSGTLVLDFTTTSTPIVKNTWAHVAVVKVGNLFTIYVNGVLAGSATASATLANGTNFVIGSEPASSVRDWNGYISNVRIVKGTAVYTADFTPPTQPLEAIANTSLLTCQSATFVDNSTNNFAITAVGNSQPVTVNPFGSSFVNSTGYTAAEYGGSMSFDGTGDYLTMPTSSGLQFGTGDFTIEAWVYLTSLANFNGVFDSRTLGGTGVAVTIFANGTIECGSGGAYITGGTFVTNRWNHVAFARSSNTGRVFLNGVQVASAAHSVNYTATDALIGKTTDNWHCFGYISNVRVIKGQAVYTSNFVPPVAPVEPVANTVLLLNGTAAAITDATTRNVLETVGDARISTAVSKFGSSSMYFNGTGDRLVSVPSIVNLLGSGNFTIEFWLYPSNTSSAYRALVSSENYPGTTGGWSLYQNGTSMEFWITSVGAATITATSAITASNWQHVALCRASGTLRLFINGTSVSSVSNSTSFTGQRIWIGDNNSSGGGLYLYNGYMQDLRITQGAARYTANFTPPTTAFQTR